MPLIENLEEFGELCDIKYIILHILYAVVLNLLSDRQDGQWITRVSASSPSDSSDINSMESFVNCTCSSHEWTYLALLLNSYNNN